METDGFIDCWKPVRKLSCPVCDAHNHLGESYIIDRGWLKPHLQHHRCDGPITGRYNWLTEQSAYDLTLFGLLNVLKHGATTRADAMVFRRQWSASIDANAPVFATDDHRIARCKRWQEY
jgi:cytosine/adenosine deaminase-related metal-dependent hydrolase